MGLRGLQGRAGGGTRIRSQVTTCLTSIEMSTEKVLGYSIYTFSFRVMTKEHSFLRLS